MSKQKYTPVIGLEVHVELSTQSKMFCSCPAHHFQIKPNTHTCPVCLGLPGALPVPNKKAIDWTIMIGLSLNCKIRKNSTFDRKNYFYPDLAKGYQISQYDDPFCENGYLALDSGKKIGINRVHLEEDTGKLIHEDKSTLIDFNRSGVPLVEIVTQPDAQSAKQAVEYLKKLQQTIRYLGVSDADMEKGSMRLEPNISLKKPGQKNLPEYKVEVKNINSFRFVKKAIEYELKRQEKILSSGQIPTQETRGFNESNGKTFSQRTKEGAADYRYFPDPDIPPISLSDQHIKKIKSNMPELPEEKRHRFKNDYGLSKEYIKILTETAKSADYFETLTKLGKKQNITVKKLANVVVNKRVDTDSLTPQQVVKKIVQKKSSKVSDQAQIEAWVKKVVSQNPQAVSDYKSGKKEALGYLLGQVMSESKGKADPGLTRKLLLKHLE